MAGMGWDGTLVGCLTDFDLSLNFLWQFAKLDFAAKILDACKKTLEKRRLIFNKTMRKELQRKALIYLFIEKQGLHTNSLPLLVTLRLHLSL